MNYDDVSEMRLREASIILPPPNDFTAEHCHDKFTDDNGEVVINSTTTSSSGKHHDKHQRIDKRREHMDVNTWIV